MSERKAERRRDLIQTSNNMQKKHPHSVLPLESAAPLSSSWLLQAGIFKLRIQRTNNSSVVSMHPERLQKLKFNSNNSPVVKDVSSECSDNNQKICREESAPCLSFTTSFNLPRAPSFWHRVSAEWWWSMQVKILHQWCAYSQNIVSVGAGFCVTPVSFFLINSIS